MLMTTLIAGLVLGGTYALVAMGLTIQYGIARTMNLAYGETIIAASFAAYLIHNALGASPILGLAVVAPAGFALGWLIYRLVLRPLVRRSKGGPALEVDSILATFGLLFVIQGVMLVGFGGNYISYSYMNFGVDIFGASVAANRLLALVLALAIGGGLYLLLTRTRWGTALRAVAVHLHLASGDRLRGHRSRLEEARRPKPLVEADPAVVGVLVVVSHAEYCNDRRDICRSE